MAETRLSVPENIKIYLELECCSDFPIQRYFVTKEQNDIIDEVIRASNRAAEMAKLGLRYFNSTLLYGPPGTGKTTFGRYMSYYFDMDLMYLNFAMLCDEKGPLHLKEIFEYATKTRCIFLLDEIDQIGRSRDLVTQDKGGAQTAMVIALMQALDDCRKKDIECVIIGCTNNYNLLDKALRNRFSLKHEFGNMTTQEKSQYIHQYLNSVNIACNDENIRLYCADAVDYTQRVIEADLNRCIGNWIDRGKTDFILDHDSDAN